MTVVDETASAEPPVLPVTPTDRGGGRLGAVLRQPLGLLAAGWLVFVVAGSTLGRLIVPRSPTEIDLDSILSGPSTDHWLGADSLGRDVLSRLVHGGLVSLSGVAEAVVVAIVIGVPAGLIAGYYGGILDRLIGWVVDIVLAIPVIVTLLMVLSVFGSNQIIAMAVLGVLGAPAMARVVRGATLAVRGELYVAAARVAGLPSWQIVRKHILPVVAGPIIVQGSVFAGLALLVQTSLDYLGLGVQPPTPTWGGEVGQAATAISQQPWLLVPSGTVIGLTILAFGLLGDVVRDLNAQRSTTAPRPFRPAKRDAHRRLDASPIRARDALLSMSAVSIAVPTADGLLTVVEGLDLAIGRGEIVGLVGESGCGKSVTGKAVLALPSGGTVTAGSVVFDGVDTASLDAAGRRRLRGSEISLISQEPIASLDPVFTVGSQLKELVRRHDGGSRSQVRDRALGLLRDVRLPEPDAVMARYPHELSGGMAQRVAIAQALAGRPRLLIADEPTTALDVTVQAEILDLLRELNRAKGMSILLITHNWGVVADMCQRAYVMYAGHVVECSGVDDMFRQPRHPYTSALLGSMPKRSLRGQKLPAIAGTVPNPRDWPKGCHFQARCALATPECSHRPIPLLAPTPQHMTRCIHHDELTSGPSEND